MASKLDDIAWPVRTERLTLRPATESDIEPTWRIRSQESVSLWITATPGTLEEYREMFVNPERLAKSLVVELDGEVIGDLMLAVEDGWSQREVAEQAKGVQAELGWCIDPAQQGHGYGTEAVEALIRICFDHLSLRRVTANCFADNEASWRLMERVGMRREMHTVRESLHRCGEWLDGLGYALLADEWRARRSDRATSRETPISVG
ncbi:MAG TPA: GNAT family protein [Nocardioidaceae bacterium]|nr:GNAT family protein [Nocardioidaceae bacterium]